MHLDEREIARLPSSTTAHPPLSSALLEGWQCRLQPILGVFAYWGQLIVSSSLSDVLQCILWTGSLQRVAEVILELA